jgi:hypothetical protein
VLLSPTRIYDPVTGRFLQNEILVSRRPFAHYQYAEQNPLSFTDPLGLANCGATAQICSNTPPKDFQDQPSGYDRKSPFWAATKSLFNDLWLKLLLMSPISPLASGVKQVWDTGASVGSESRKLTYVYDLHREAGESPVSSLALSGSLGVSDMAGPTAFYQWGSGRNQDRIIFSGDYSQTNDWGVRWGNFGTGVAQSAGIMAWGIGGYRSFQLQQFQRYIATIGSIDSSGTGKVLALGLGKEGWLAEFATAENAIQWRKWFEAGLIDDPNLVWSDFERAFGQATDRADLYKFNWKGMELGELEHWASCGGAKQGPIPPNMTNWELIRAYLDVKTRFYEGPGKPMSPAAVATLRAAISRILGRR